MFDYSPKLPELIFYPTFAGLFAWGITRAYPSPESYLFLGAVCVNSALVGSFYLWRESCKFVDGQQGGEPSPRPNAQEPVKQYLNMNIAENKEAYNQNTMSLKIDPQKHFFGIVLQQYEQGFDVDLTEPYWLDPIKSPSGKKSYKRWQGKNQEFRDLKKKWEGVIFGRENENKNSRFIIQNVEMLRQGARGQLPH